MLRHAQTTGLVFSFLRIVNKILARNSRPTFQALFFPLKLGDHDDGEGNNRQKNRRNRVDDRADAELDHRINLDRQRRRIRPLREKRDDEIVNRKREAEQRRADNAGRDDRQRDVKKGFVPACAQIHRGLLQRPVKTVQPSLHDDNHVSEAEGDMRNCDGR